MLMSKLFRKPLSTENNMKAKEYTNTQLIKFGSVVSVCTIFLKGAFFISVRKIAKMTGRTEVRMPSRTDRERVS